MLPAVQSALAIVTVALLLAQAPSKPAPQQRQADRERARQLLSRAVAASQQIEDADLRVQALTQIAVQQFRAGDASASAESMIAARSLIEPGAGTARSASSNRRDVAAAFGHMGDAASAMQIVDSAAHPRERDSLLAAIVRSYGVPGRLVAAADLAQKITEPSERDRALLDLMRPVGPGRPSVDELQNIAARIRGSNYQSRAQAIVGAAKIRAGNPTGDRDLADASQLAASASGDSNPFFAGEGWPIGCRGNRPESAPDAALRRVAEERLRAGDIAGALSDVEKIASPESREALLARVAVAQIYSKDFAAAEQSASRITRVTCRDNTIAAMGLQKLRSGDFNAALNIAARITTPMNRAEVFATLAATQLSAKRPTDALQLASAGLHAARDVANPDIQGRLVTTLAALQSASGAAPLAIQTLRQFTADTFAHTPPQEGWLPRPLREIVICQAGLGDAKSALATVEKARPVERPFLILPMARRQSNFGDAAGALLWVEALQNPAEKTLGLTGAAMGLSYPRGHHSECGF